MKSTTFMEFNDNLPPLVAIKSEVREETEIYIKTEPEDYIDEIPVEVCIKQEDIEIKEEHNSFDDLSNDQPQPSTSTQNLDSFKSLIDDVRKSQKRKLTEMHQVDCFQQHTKKVLGSISESLEGMHAELKKISGALVKLAKK